MATQQAANTKENKQLTFKFTRGGIKLNIEKLDHFNGKYRDLLLREPLAALPPHEVALLRTHLLAPTLAVVRSNTASGIAAWPRSSAPLQLVPQLANNDGDDNTSAAYIHAVLASRDGGFRAAGDVVEQHPYLFWRPPQDVYRASVAATPPDGSVLAALEQVLARDDVIWGDGQGVVDALREMLEPQGVEALTMHNVLRLVGAGGQDVVSQSSGRMFATLGRDEWQHRLRCVQKLV